MKYLKPMDLILHNQISFEELSKEKFDYFICASGNEIRCTYIAENISLKGLEKFVLLYNENFDNENRFQNLIFLKLIILRYLKKVVIPKKLFSIYLLTLKIYVTINL